VENPPRVFQALWEGGPSEGLAFHRASDPQLGEEGVQGEERANPSTAWRAKTSCRDGMRLFHSLKVSGEKDFFVVTNVGGHELVDELVPLAGQRDECGDMRFGVAGVAAEFLAIVGSVHSTVFDGND